MNELNVKVGDVISARIVAAKNGVGQWLPPQLRLTVIREIGVTDYVVDPEMKASEPFHLIKAADIYCPLPSSSDVNTLHPTLGISPIAFPDYIVKKNPEKAGRIFERAKDFIDGNVSATNMKPLFQARAVDGWTEVKTLDEADRVTIYLFMPFGHVVEPIDSFCRVARVRDADADGGWSDAKPWRQNKVRDMRTTDGNIEPVVIEHLSVKPLSPFHVDRPAVVTTPSIKADGVGETML